MGAGGYVRQMRTLWLLRHAKSDWPDDVPDHERPLDGRGRDAARRIGRYLAGCEAAPRQVLCSTALRARQTFEGLAAELAAPPPCELAQGLYLAGPGELLGRVQDVSDAVQSVMLIAHNPGIAELAMALARRGDAELRRSLHAKYPTGALTELRLDGARWSEADRGGELAGFVVPRLLPAVL